MEISSGGDAVQSNHCVAVIAEAETRRRRTVTNIVLSVENDGLTADPFTPRKFLHAQIKDMFCRKHHEWENDPQSCFVYDRYKTLVYKSELDGALWRIVPEQLRRRVLKLTQLPVLAGNSCKLGFSTLQEESFTGS